MMFLTILHVEFILVPQLSVVNLHQTARQATPGFASFASSPSSTFAVLYAGATGKNGHKM